MKRLIFRLSSLGDVILAQSALEPNYSGETHWVIAREFEALVQGNPKIQRVWAFDRKKDGSLGAWLELLRRLFDEGFDEVLDLHSTLRTKIARIYFFFLSMRSQSSRAKWRVLSKGRFRRLGYLFGKGFWPSSLRPTHLSKACARLSGGTGAERSNLKWLAEKARKPVIQRGGEILLAVAPSSAWRQKEWPAEKYAALVQELRSREKVIKVLLFGTGVDIAAVRLKSLLQEKGIPFDNYIGGLSLPEVAKALGQCDLIVGPDTGLIHLAESVGTPAVVLYGPTRSDFGFGSSRKDSKAVHGPVRCSPCSKDGTLCYRFGDRYACLRKMKVESVLHATFELIRDLSKNGSAMSEEVRP